MINQILFGLIYALSKLPMRVLYIFSDVIFFVLYYIIKYRREVVDENLCRSFPEKSKEELAEVRKKFFRNFADYLVEMVKAMSISEKELKIRVQHINQEIFHQIKTEQKNTILLAGHIFNWEWLTAFSTILPQEHCHPVYRKVKNPFWEEKIKLIRNRFGNQSIRADKVLRSMMKAPVDGDFIYLFVADQTPHSSEVVYGMEFLHQRTPVFIGYDKVAQRLNYAFVYAEIKKVKRGFYQVNYHRIEPDSERFEEYEVVRKFHQRLEETIRKRPDNWLWSHKRWKYQHNIKKYEA